MQQQPSIPVPGARWLDEEVETLRKLVDDGLTRSQIAAKMLRTVQSIQNKTERENIVCVREKKVHASWPEETCELAKSLWKDGQSAQQVANILNAKTGRNYTRNAVIGFLHRNRLHKSETDRTLSLSRGGRLGALRTRQANKGHGRTSEPKPPKAAPDIVRVEVKAEPSFVNISVVPATACTLADIGPRCCRWPLNTPPQGRADETLFCAADTGGDEVYCAVHKRRANEPSRPRKVRPVEKAIARRQFDYAFTARR